MYLPFLRIFGVNEGWWILDGESEREKDGKLEEWKTGEMGHIRVVVFEFEIIFQNKLLPFFS